MTSPISSTSSTAATPVNTSYQPKPLVVPNTSSGALSSLATSLASQSAIVASLGGSTSGVSVYSPSGLLNSLIQAGADTSSADGGTAATGDSGTTTGTGATGTGTDGTTASTGTSGSTATAATPPTAQQLADSAIIGSISNSSSAQTVGSTDTSANWSTILKTNPSLAGTVISSSFDQGIVATLRTTA